MGNSSWFITLALVFLSGRTVEGGLPCENFGVGIGDRAKVKNSQMTASTVLGSDYRAFNARLDSPIDRGWCASANGAQGSYLEIDLERDYAFCGIRIQGAAHGHVNTFQLRFARDKEGSFIPFGTTFSRFTAEEENEEFHPTTPFPVGSVVRLYPLTFSGTVPCVRLELFGFPEPTVTCSPQYIIAEFKRSNYPDLESSEMHLTDTSCSAESENDTYITFHIPFRNCSTVRVQTPEHLEYRNEVMRRITQGVITYKMDMNFPITCRYDRNVTLNDLDIEVEEEEEETEEPADSGARLQPCHWLLATLWLSGAFLYRASVAGRGQF